MIIMDVDTMREYVYLRRGYGMATVCDSRGTGFKIALGIMRGLRKIGLLPQHI